MRFGCCTGIAAAVIAPAALQAQGSRWFAKSWQTDDGLPNNTVVGVAQSREGYLWLGTPTGLVRFDGFRFQRISSTNLVQTPNRGVLVMTGLRDGGLGIGMVRGAVALVRTNSVRIFHPGKQIPDAIPLSLVEDRKNVVWLSYRDGSVCRIEGETVSRLVESKGDTTPDTMCALALDHDDRVWYAVGGELGIIVDGRLRKLHSISPAIARLAPAADGAVWVCSGSRILKCSFGGEIRQMGELPAVNASPTALIEDREGALWIGTEYDGLFYFDGTRAELVSTSHQEIRSLLEDQEGSIWVGTTGGGLNQVRRRVVELEGMEEGLPFGAVQSICEAPDGVLWAATQNGALARRINGRWEPFVPEPQWTGQAICVTADASGGIWIGTRNQGLYYWKDNRLQPWGNAAELTGRTIHALQIGAAGELWIGESSPGAIQRLHEGKLSTLRVPVEDLRVIRAIALGPDGSAWFGTSRGTLLRVKGDSGSDETARTLRTADSIRTLYTSPEGTIWIGYAGDGLGRIQNDRYTNIRTEHGLYDDYISHIVADGRGWLWFAGDRGIFKVREQELQDFAEGRIEEVRSIHYGKGDGLPSLQGNFGGAPGAFRSRDGRIWIPMRTALAVVHPSRLRESSEPPPVLLDRVLVDEQAVPIHRHILTQLQKAGNKPTEFVRERNLLKVQPRHHSLRFEFTSPSFAASENMRFRHRLEGVDTDWTESAKERSASYARLPAGSYTFRVIAANSDDHWNREGVALSILVLPFFWQTWWFRTVVFIAFTGLMIAVVRYVSFRRLQMKVQRLEQQEALYKERARIAKDIHDDVGANLTQIALLGDLVQQDGGVEQRVGARLERISGTARQAVKSLDEIVWAVNPRNDTLAHLVDYTGQFALDYLRVAGVRCRLDLPEQPPVREISTDVRHNLFLVVKEALNNIVKHSRATEVWLRIHASDTHLSIAVEDNGVGFEKPADTAEADGLKNMQQRIADISGSCRIESHAPGGTKVLVELPWNLMRG